MDVLELRPINISDQSLLQEWHKDAELGHRISPPDEKWMRYVTESPQVKAWIVMLDAQPIGYAQLDIDPHMVGHLMGALRSDFRGRGLGVALLHLLISQCRQRLCYKVRAGVESDNIPSIKCLEKVGFLKVGDETEGIISFQLMLS